MTVHFLFEQAEENQSKLLCIVISFLESCRNASCFHIYKKDTFFPRIIGINPSLSRSCIKPETLWYLYGRLGAKTF